MNDSEKPCSCRFCGGRKTPQGIRSHETWCDENPNPGVPPDRQPELEAESDPAPDATEADEPELPPVETLAPQKKPPDASADDVGGADAGAGDSCPLCGTDDVLPAADAREGYREAVETPRERILLAYSLADWACQNADCAALWGGSYPEPAPMEAIA